MNKEPAAVRYLALSGRPSYISGLDRCEAARPLHESLPAVPEAGCEAEMAVTWLTRGTSCAGRRASRDRESITWRNGPYQARGRCPPEQCAARPPLREP